MPFDGEVVVAEDGYPERAWVWPIGELVHELPEEVVEGFGVVALMTGGGHGRAPVNPRGRAPAVPGATCTRRLHVAASWASTCGRPTPIYEFSNGRRGTTSTYTVLGCAMIRVVYRWSVVAGQEQAFVAAWRAVTLILRERVEGARGSLLLRDPEAPQEFTAVARWTSRAALAAFRGAPPEDPALAAHAAVLRAAASKRSEAVLDELEDLTLA